MPSSVPWPRRSGRATTGAGNPTSPRRPAVRLIAGNGATYYGIGSVARFLDVVLHAQRAVLTVSCRIEDGGALRGVTLSLPHLVSARGALAVVPPPLADDERRALDASAALLRDAIVSG